MTTVILFDVDYTLFDTERFRATLSAFAGERSSQLWEAYAAVRATEPAASLPAALARLAGSDPATAQALTTALAQLDYRRFLVPGVGAVLAAARALGQPVILSEGDPPFQQEKIRRAGLAEAVDGRVLVYPEKAAHLAAVVTAFPASHYWMVDDRARLLGWFKRLLGLRSTTVQICRGPYAAEPPDPGDPWPDHRVAEIGALVPLLQRAAERSTCG